jgi:ketosteroid isomerase-like protein
MRGMDEMTIPAPNGTLMTVHMRGISIWRRGADEQWRCAADIGNAPPATN